MNNKCCCDCKYDEKVSVKIYDSDGEVITVEDVDWIHTNDWRTVEVHLKKDSVRFSDDEIELLRNLVMSKIEDGAYLHLVRKYLVLFDKLEKNLEENSVNE